MAAIIFDLDGTLIDTEESWDIVRRGLARDAGLAWPDGATQAMMGMSTQEWSAYLVDAVGLPGTPDEAARLTIEAMAAHHRAGVDVLPGAVEAVRRMADRYPVAIASSSPRVLIDAAVEALGIGDLLQATVSTEEVERGKPAPDGYLRACELLGVAPGEAVAVEDAPNGIRSALAAGMAVVAVPPHFHPPGAELLAEATVVESLDQLTLDVVAEALSRAAS
ncbi:HAD family hydrolase [Tessaracoccus palaemonis]|uniref:HAD family phosphatase n=1 Tax=Tessaracoccus palaemonis TaxID=2829499 RepID=A0ABX8SLN4_9ACTN|nr:HAD family phosphatase [Tessaracoccus palaemonis]QXT63849.1 HAD family phosphatase [Tessaracoccus palaemonis]